MTLDDDSQWMTLDEWFSIDDSQRTTSMDDSRWKTLIQFVLFACSRMPKATMGNEPRDRKQRQRIRQKAQELFVWLQADQQHGRRRHENIEELFIWLRAELHHGREKTQELIVRLKSPCSYRIYYRYNNISRTRWIEWLNLLPIGTSKIPRETSWETEDSTRRQH